MPRNPLFCYCLKDYYLHRILWGAFYPNSETLLHSLSTQVSYYSSLIQNNPEWEYVGVYADEGVTGTSQKHRNELNRLLADCEEGKIDMILVKSISRFARNTVDCLEATRHLRELGIAVYFERENINSLTQNGELCSHC